MSIKTKLRNVIFGVITATAVFSYSSAYTYSVSRHNITDYDITKITTVMKKIVSHGKPPDLKTFTIVVVNDESFNASASQPLSIANAVITVNTGALKFLKNEDELAFVLSHEWAHILLGHTRIDDVYEEDSINSEKYADLVGQQLARLAGYDPGYGSDIWDRVIQEHGDVGGITHPMCSERAHYLRIHKLPINQLHELLYDTGEYLIKNVPQSLKA